MNLLNFKNRFENLEPTDKNIGEVNGYLLAIMDMMEYVKEITEYNPAKRMIDAVDILEAIRETNERIGEVQENFVRRLTESGITGIYADSEGTGRVLGRILTEDDIPEDLFTQLRHSEIL